MNSKAMSLAFGLVTSVVILSGCASKTPEYVDPSLVVIADSSSEKKQGDWELVGVFDSGVDLNTALGERQFFWLVYDHAVAIVTCDAEGDPKFHLKDSNGAMRPADWTKDEESGQYTVVLALSSTDRYTIESLTATLGDSTAEWGLSYRAEEYDWPETVLTDVPFSLTGVEFELYAGTVPAQSVGPASPYERVVLYSELNDEFGYEVTVEWPGIYGEAVKNSYDLRSLVDELPVPVTDSDGPYEMVPVLSVMKYRGEKVVLELPVSGDDAVNRRERVGAISEPQRKFTALGREILFYGVHIGRGGSRGETTDIRFFSEDLSLIDGGEIKSGDFVFKAASTNFGKLVRWRSVGDGSIVLTFEVSIGLRVPDPLEIELDFREVVDYERATAVLQGGSYVDGPTPSAETP